ncbi:hypothetical protein [Hymenobacter pini]|uniref:hypothetical protein n=1 Tax=Hymenobacter pini TaxID=2880879 RepID=UPI001CF121EE|nr:hypothetical protein [Hymenobacter pini]MCA8830985.1 hypothetical protein [Hymenobacter pini]
MKKLFFVGAYLWMLVVFPVLAADPEVVIVKIIEIQGRSKVVINRGEGNIEELDLPLGISNKNVADVTTVYHRVAKQLYQEGVCVAGADASH